MAFFDTLRERVTDLAQTGVAKSMELAEIGKLKLDNASEEDTMKKAFTELGKVYYAEHGMVAEGAYGVQCRKIQVAKEAIQKNKSAMEKLKADGDISDSEYAQVVTEVPPEDIIVEVETETKTEDTTN